MTSSSPPENSFRAGGRASFAQRHRRTSTYDQYAFDSPGGTGLPRTIGSKSRPPASKAVFGRAASTLRENSSFQEVSSRRLGFPKISKTGLLVGTLQALLVILAVRCAYLQGWGGERLRFSHAKRVSASEVKVEPRGRVLTADGVVLARDESYFQISVDPVFATRKCAPTEKPAQLEFEIEEFRRAVEPAQVVNWETIKAAAVGRLEQGAMYFPLLRLDDPNEVERFLKWRGKGGGRGAFKAEERVRRVYPHGSVAEQILGPETSPYCYWGIERHFRSQISSVRGVVKVFRDAADSPLYSEEIEGLQGRAGRDVVLSIHFEIQRIVEERIRRLWHDTRSLGVTALVADPRTGDVLAAASVPTFDDLEAMPSFAPELQAKFERRREPHFDYKGYCRPGYTQFTWEPGSIIKPLLVSEALSRGISPELTVKPKEGREQFVTLGSYRRRVVDVTRRGPLTLEGALKYSSNIGMVHLGGYLERDGIRHAFQRFRLREPSGLPLLEESGTLTPLSLWGDSTSVVACMGYALLVTPVKIVRAYNTIASNGLDRPLRIVRSVGGVAEPLARTTPRLHRSVAREIRRILHHAIRDASGLSLDRAEVEKLGLAGKTGTTHKATWNPEKAKKTYDENVYQSSFVGFAPYDEPKYVMIVVVDEPQGEYYGARVARPVVLETLRDLVDPDRGCFGLDRSTQSPPLENPSDQPSSSTTEADPLATPPEDRPVGTEVNYGHPEW